MLEENLMDDRDARQLQKDLKMIDPMLERLFVKGDVKKLQTLLTDGPYLERHPEIGGLIKKYEEYVDVEKAKEGGKIQKKQTGGSVEGRAEDTLAQVEKQAGLTQAPELPTGTDLSYTPIQEATPELLATPTLGTVPTQAAAQTGVAQTVADPTKTAAGVAAEIPIEGASAKTLAEMTGQAGTVSTAAQMTEPQGTVSTDAQATAATGSAAQAIAATRALDSTKLADMKTTGELLTATKLSDLGVSAEQVTAETSEVDSLATVQGQLQKLSTQFEDENIPSFMAGAVRAANAAVNARGLGRSSYAAQAIYQAALESSVAIAVQDAKVYEKFAGQNLSNKQQAAVLNAEIRARIQGQELTNEQQSRVLNAARITEVNNMDLNNQQQVVLENAKLTQNMNLSNLNNAQQTAMANAATFASMDVRNLDTRVQSAKQNAQSFLQMDMANLSNLQQAQTVNQQAKMQRLFNYEAAENARQQFNAKSQQQQDQFFAESLS